MTSNVTKKEAILQTATVFFSEQGFRDTSMSEIAKVTGVADGTIFYHFKSKEELFLAVLQNFKEVILMECQNFLANNEFESGLDMVERMVSFYIDLADNMEERFLLLHRHYPYKLAEENPTCRRYLEDIYNCFADLFETAIRKGQEDGSIGNVSARKTALLIFTMVDGLVRLGTYNLYQTKTLYKELTKACRGMLEG